MVFILIKFYIAIALSLFVPGYFFIKLLLQKSDDRFSVIEKLLLSFSFSLIITNFLVIVMDFLSIAITAKSIFAVLVGTSAILAFLSWKSSLKRKGESQVTSKFKFVTLRNFSYRQILIFLSILLLSCLIRTFYVSDGIVPQTTDLGHHIYWSKTISESGQLPNYGMPDFIIGEHIIFSVVSLLSGFSYISAMPVVILFLINIFSLLAVSICAYWLISAFTSKEIGKTSSFFTLLIVGTFFATSSPQAKFIAGGVIGNLIGNLFIPLAIYLFIVAIRHKDPNIAKLFYICLAGLAFTHHLSTFIFLYVFAGFFIFFIALALIAYRFNFLKLFEDIRPYLLVFLSKSNLATLVLIIGFALFVHMPSYLNKSAVDTAVGAPSKSTRVGLPIGAITLSVGAWKFFYSLLGVIVLGLITLKQLSKKASEKTISRLVSIAFLFSWFFVIFLMSAKPALLKVDIISGRIVSYITYPLAIFSAFFIVFIFTKLFKKASPMIAQILFFVVIGTGMISGFADISDSTRNSNPLKENLVLQTYRASEFLNGIAKKDENVLKDHIHLEGDTWMKLFFMKGYKYPLSRSYLRRYEDITKKRETCTRDMIAIPSSEIGGECFKETKVKYVVLKNGFDNAQFEKSNDFSKIYASSNVVIYQKYDEK